MPKRELIKGNEAIVYGALAGGVRCYFGYPITPQNDIPELLSGLLPKQGGQFVQAESEIGAINMLLGAASCGVRAMVSSSSPGISLMQEGISYMAGSELPGVIVNMVRGGPGLGDISPSQADYFQATRGGGHGDYRTLVLAPSTCQECHDMAKQAFSLAFKYRNPVLVLGDAMVGQMKEPVVCDEPMPMAANGEFPEEDQSSSWCLAGNAERPARLIKSVWLNDNYLGVRVAMLAEKYLAMREDAEAELLAVDDAELVLVAFGSMGRIAGALAMQLRKQGKKIGLFRPKTLYPFPSPQLADLEARGKRFLVLEQNTGQMVEDVRLSLKKPDLVGWFGVMPGRFPGVDDIWEPVLTFLASQS